MGMNDALGDPDQTNVIERHRTEYSACCRRVRWPSSSYDIENNKESKQNLWRRIIGLIFPDIDQAQARFEEYEAKMYGRIKQYQSDADQVGGPCGFLRKENENKTGDIKADY
ncbi:unnamed protein product [Fusarium venenatum]|uniref:Uncharacterized protein n=1 Tax=Fusarium venenatum TaxID=56646 RepID=A0A2L2TXE1_9HYPO|nr:uncharacterized protein FVRRES_09403 [Fusarium venenatum]CEI69326.1 unnamed protein product [Fusarium venenatum]